MRPTRFATRAPGARWVALSGIAVFLVIAGILAMHTLSLDHTPPASVGTSAAAKPMHGAAAPGPGGAVAVTHAAAAPAGEMTTGCGGESCGMPMPDHTMLMAVCVLALLAAALVLALPRLLARAGILRPRLLSAARALLAALPDPRPPSLHVLSISRT